MPAERALPDVHLAADIIRSSKRTVVLTGAGISTPSGIPDFRSPNVGLWEQYDPSEVASLISFRYDPVKFYQALRPLALKVFQAQPNPAHHALARMEQAGYVFVIITQNADSLHQKAGSKNVLEVHGSMRTLTCVSCYRKVPSSGLIEAYIDRGEIPYCQNCGGVLKPDLILFGEQLPAKTWLRALESSMTCDLMIVAGSSLEVLPVAGLPMRALERGAHLIIINRTPTYLDVRADVLFHEDVAIVVPAIAKELLEE